MILRIYAWMQDQQITWGTLMFFICIPVATIITGLIILSVIFAFTSTEPITPPCQEDEFIVGIGNFASNGYWDSYICIHPDVIING